eukprot:287551_1
MSTTQFDMKLIVLNYVRSQYESKFDQIDIPIPLKDLITSYANLIIGSKLLTFDEDTKLAKTIFKKISNIATFTVLYRASDHGFNKTQFHNKCDSHGPTITIIYSSSNTIFGAYCYVPWNSTNNDWMHDGKAFIFMVRSNVESNQHQLPLLFPIKGTYGAVYHGADAHPMFGTGDIFIHKDNSEKSNHHSGSTEKRCYEYGAFTESLCGGIIDERNQDCYNFEV